MGLIGFRTDELGSFHWWWLRLARLYKCKIILFGWCFYETKLTMKCDWLPVYPFSLCLCTLSKTLILHHRHRRAEAGSIHAARHPHVQLDRSNLIHNANLIHTRNVYLVTINTAAGRTLAAYTTCMGTRCAFANGGTTPWPERVDPGYERRELIFF